MAFLGNEALQRLWAHTISRISSKADEIKTWVSQQKVSAFENDAGYLTEHQDISGKLDADKLPEAINNALAQAAESGEFNGEPGYSPVRGTDYWTPADQEAITEEVSNQLSLEIGVVPEYVKAEAESVIERVSAAQAGRTFTFAAITDLHYGNGGYTDGVLHSCQALKYIDERLKLDAVAVLGDYTDGYPADGLANAFGDFRAVNAVLNDLRFAPNLRTQGNHDYYADNAPKIRRHIQAYSEDVVWGDIAGGYYHKDFDAYKLRVIVLNTTETGNANIDCTTAQYQWFADTLDLSAKEDAEEWQILVLSHHPLDWYHIDESYALARIANAYREGTAYSITGVSCDFSDGKNAAVLIGNIHGHIHNLLVDKVHIGNVVNGVKSEVDRMATPESCINRANQYTGAWQEETSYHKTIGTAEDTSFVIYCIDLDTYTIQAVCYGAGYDRTLTYYVAKNGYTNQIPISVDSAGAVYNGTGYKADYRLNSSGTETELAGTGVTGFIPVKRLDVVRMENISYKPGVDSTGDYIALYDSDFTKTVTIKSPYVASHDYVLGSRVLDDDGNLIQFTMSDSADAGHAYMRVSCAGLGAESIITVNEEITE